LGADAAKQWYESTATGWTSSSGEPFSPNGASIAAPTSRTLTDGDGHVWSLWPTQSTYGDSVERDGGPFAGGQAIELIVKNGVIWALNSAKHWYESTATGWIAEPGLPDPPAAWTNSAGGSWQTSSN
jgi:hypothetical protein